MLLRVVATFTYKDVTIKVAVCDITKIYVDAIVNAANSLMYMGGGVAGAIRRIGGIEIEEEAIKKAPVPVGKAIYTTAGKLNAKWVIHAPTMERPAMRIPDENVALATYAALSLANEMGIKSIALPALGTGVGGVNRKIAAQLMVEEIKKHIDNGTSLQKIILCDIHDEQAIAFKKSLNKLL